MQRVWAVVAKLPPPQREALLLVAGQGMTYEAAVIGGPLTTLAEFDLRRGSLHVPDEQRLADLFGGVLPEQPFA